MPPAEPLGRGRHARRRRGRTPGRAAPRRAVQAARRLTGARLARPPLRRPPRRGARSGRRGEPGPAHNSGRGGTSSPTAAAAAAAAAAADAGGCLPEPCPAARLARSAPLPLGVLGLLLIVAVYAAGILVIQLQALLAGRRLAVLRHHGGRREGRGRGSL